MEKKSKSINGIEVLSFENEAINSMFLPRIKESYDTLRVLLPHLPEAINIEFGTNYDYGEDGVTGSALSPNSMKIGIRIDQEDRSSQLDRIQAVVMHEGYHIGQGFYNSEPCSALEAAIYEGCATVFERDTLGSAPRYADYSMHSKDELKKWLSEIQTINADQYFEPSGETWRKWAFYDEETDASWRIYKTGTWVVDRVMAQTGLRPIDLNVLSANEIIAALNTKTS
jgi:hypothetical protein